MRVAIPTRQGRVEAVFSKAEEFTIYEVEIELVRSKTTVPFNGNLARFLTEQKANIMICGSIRSFDRNVLRLKRVELLYGVSGEVDEVMVRYLSGENLGTIDENALWRADREGLR